MYKYLLAIATTIVSMPSYAVGEINKTPLEISLMGDVKEAKRSSILHGRYGNSFGLLAGIWLTDSKDKVVTNQSSYSTSQTTCTESDQHLIVSSTTVTPPVCNTTTTNHIVETENRYSKSANWLIGADYRFILFDKFGLSVGLVYIDKTNIINSYHINTNIALTYDITKKWIMRADHITRGVLPDTHEDKPSGSWNLLGIGYRF